MTITNQKLEWIITQHGKDRITELLNNPDSKIRITRMGIGQSSESTPQQRELNGGLLDEIEVYIPIRDKGLAEDRENTVYFKAFIEEDMSGFEIAELALYDEVVENGVTTEKMFAIGVGQPIAKPRLEDNYVYSIQYTLFIESTNLLEVYDRIELDPANEFLKETDMETLYRTVIYLEGNLAEQIGNNTHIIGLNRARQLDELISKTQIHYNSAAIANYYSSLVSSVEDISDIMSFWSFHYLSNFGMNRTIKDFSTYLNYLNTNNIIANYPQEYECLMSTLNFSNGNYFYLNPIRSAISMSKDLEIGDVIDHTMIDDITYSVSKAAWLTKAGEKSESYVKSNIIMYYLKGDDATLHPVIVDHQVIPNTIELELDSETGLPHIGPKGFGPHTWEFDLASQTWTCDDIHSTIDEGTFINQVVRYKNVVGHEDEPPLDRTRITINVDLEKTPEDGMCISLTGNRFDLIKYNAGNVPMDSPFTFIASLKHNQLGNRNTLLAQSDYFQGIHNFEIVKNEDDAIEVTVFSTRDDMYVKFTTSEHAVADKFYNLIVIYDPNYNAYNEPSPTVQVFINNILYNTTKTESWRELGDQSKMYRGMDNNLLETGCFVRQETTNARINTIDAQICLMALVKEKLDADIIRCNALMLNSLTGKTVYYRV